MLPETKRDVSDLLKKIAMIKPWMAGIEKDAHALVTDGHEIPGWILAPTRATRRWKSDLEIITFMAQNTDLQESNFYIEKLKSPAQMGKMLDDPTILDGLVESVSLGTKLVQGDPEPDMKQDLAKLRRTLR